MGELKPGWKRVKFGQVVRLNRDRSKDPEADGLNRYVGLEHIEPGDLRVRSWGDVADGTTFTNRFRPGQVLFGKRRAYQRKVAIADFEGVCSGDIYVFEPKDPKVLLPNVLPFICQMDAFFDHAVGTSAGSLSPRTNWKSLANYEFALPPLQEQRRIAVALSAFDRVIDAQREASIRQVSLLLSVLSHHFNTTSYDIVRLADLLVEIADYRGKTPPYISSGIPVISAENVSDGKLKNTRKWVTPETYERWLTRGIPQGGDTVLTMEAPAGEVAEFPRDQQHLLTRRVIAVRPNSEVMDSRFLYWFMRWLSAAGYWRRFAHGTTVDRLYKKDVMDAKVPVPFRAVQSAIIRVLDDVESASSALLERSTAARSTKMRLLESALLGAVA